MAVPIISHGGRTGIQLVRLFLAVAALCVAMPAVGQGGPGTAATTSGVQLYMPVDPVEEGRRFFVTILLPREFQDRPRVVLGAEGERVAPDPGFDQSVQISPDDGTRRSLLRLGFLPQSAGYGVLPSIRIEVGGEAWVTEARALPIGLRGQASVVPPDVRWEIGTGPIHQGQTILVSLHLQRTQGLALTEAISLGATTDYSMESVALLEGAESQEFYGQELLDIPLASWALTPGKSGILRLPEARVDFVSYERLAPGTEFPVLPPPPGIERSGAIGQFSVVVEVPPQILLNEPFHLVKRVEGWGNLGYLRMPSLTMPGASLLGIEDQYRLEAGQGGYRGFREQRVRMVLTQPGTYELRQEDFSFWDPETRSVTTLVQPLRTLEVESARVLQERREALLPSADTLDSGALTHWRIARPVTLVAVLALGLAIALGGRFGSKVDGWIVGLLMTGLVVMVISGMPWRDDSPRRHYQEAVEAHREGRPAEAYRSLSLARDLIPRDPFILTMMERYRAFLALEGSPPQGPLMAPGLLFLLGSGAGLGLVILFRFRVPRGLFTVITGTVLGWVLLLSLVMGGVQGLMGAPWRSWVGNEGGEIRKIPQASSQVWLVLKPGTELKQKAVSGDHLLVETPYGIQGWIEASGVLRIPGDD